MSDKNIKYKNALHTKVFLLFLYGVIIPFFVLVLLPSTYFYLYKDKIYPNIYVNNVPVGGFTKQNALDQINQQITTPTKLTLIHENTQKEIPIEELSFHYKVNSSVDEAYNTYRNTPPMESLYNRLKAPFQKKTIPLSYSLNDSLLREYISVYADEFTTEPIYPTITLVNKTITIDPGKKGTDIDIEATISKIYEKLQENSEFSVSLVSKITDPSLSDTEIGLLTTKAQSYLNKSLLLTHKDLVLTLENEELLSLLDPHHSFSENAVERLLTRVANDIEQEPKNPVFVFENNRVNEFSPAKNGIKIQTREFKDQLALGLESLENSNTITVAIPVTETSPDIATEEVNDLGIKELIGTGKSRFSGSIASRIHNIGLGSSKFNGVLIGPGEVLSFNQIIGDISALTGYKQSYIIQDGKTILGDGGGVCQVSSTLFRAALNAGLPIVERRAHSYRVTYYEQDSGPGLDATIYSPTTDLKILNDTNHHILIQTIFDPTSASLEFDIYGTSDGRVSTVTKPVITSQSPPPEDYFQDDPTLPEGQVKQIDWAAWGAKVQFDYKVTRNGETLQDTTFYSNYRPWQAKFLRGTGQAI